MLPRHVYPLDDSQPHYANKQCHCDPIVFKDGQGVTIKHRAFDGREKEEIVVQGEVLTGVRCEDCLHYINEKGERIPQPEAIKE